MELGAKELGTIKGTQDFRNSGIRDFGSSGRDLTGGGKETAKSFHFYRHRHGNRRNILIFNLIDG